MPNNNTLRQRKNSKKEKIKEGEKISSSAKSKMTTIAVGLPEDETLSQTFFKHPLVRVTPVVLLPYVIYQIIYFATLRHPEWVTNATLGLVPMRPSLGANDPRQVLILGPELAENRYISQGLAASLHLEIVNEAFDSQNYFCRDGSVSWFQFMRLMEPLAELSNNREAPFAAWKELCLDRNHTMMHLFHPKEYGPSKCSSYETWSHCWAQECFSNVKSIWACENDVNRDCPQKFVRILHQVRNPMHTIATLNATVCPHSKLATSLLNVIGGLFPDRDWKKMNCMDAMAWYTVDFHRKLIKAREAGYVHGMFQIETTSPCEVAHMAGFGDESSAMYPPNAEKITKACRDDDGNLDAMAQDFFDRVKKENKGDAIPGLTPVAMNDFDDPNLTKEIKKLVTALGYEKEGDSEFM